MMECCNFLFLNVVDCCEKSELFELFLFVCFECDEYVLGKAKYFILFEVLSMLYLELTAKFVMV